MITLKRLEVNNFKSLRSVTLVFPEQGTVLIEGYNEAGKSTLFEAVYVALYGKPLVGEDKVVRQEEVIQYGQSHAMVQLIFSIGQFEFAISRHFERGKSQQAKLLIQQPGAQPEEVNRVKAVDERILKELGNLDGDSLRNSCFVEQKELGRIEAMSLDQRKQAIQKLLGLERLTRLMEQFKFRREQERELIQAQNYLKLAQLQADIRAASAEESELGKRFDAVKVAVHVERLSGLNAQNEELEKHLQDCKIRTEEARKQLTRCAALKEYVNQCDEVSHQIVAITHARTELLRLAGELERLHAIEQVELPQARAYLSDVSAAAEAVGQTMQARIAVQSTKEAVWKAQRLLEGLKQAEDEQRQKEDEVASAESRIVQRRREAESEQQRISQQLNTLGARKLHLEEAFASVKTWEVAKGELQALQEAMRDIETQGQTLLTLQMRMQQREKEARDLEQAAVQAEKEMQRATERVRLARAYEALNEWMRLKGVERTLGGYTMRHTELMNRREEAEISLSAARTRTRTPFFAGIALAVLAVFALVLGFLWPAAFALSAIFLCGAVLAWLWYFSTRKNVQQRSEALVHCTQDLQHLDMQRQAAIQAGGDPVSLRQYEQQMLSSGLAVPATLEAGQILQEQLRQQLGEIPANATLQESAQFARDKHTRLSEQLRIARFSVDEIRKELYLAQQSGKPAEQLARLKMQAQAQEKIVATDEELALQSVLQVGQWPTSSNALHASLASCQAEQHATEEALKRQEERSSRSIQEAKIDKEKADHALQQAREKVATVKTNNPAAQLFRAQKQLAEMEATCSEREEATRQLLSKVRLQLEEEVEPEKGRADARVQALQKDLMTRSLRQEEYTIGKARFINSLTATLTMLRNLLSTASSLSVMAIPSLPHIPDTIHISFPFEQTLSATLGEIRKALQTTLVTLDEQGTRNILDEALSEQGRINHEREVLENEMKSSQQTINTIFSSRGISNPSIYTYESIITCWPFIGLVSPYEDSQVAENLEEVRRHLYAIRREENQLAAELQHPGTPLRVEACKQKVDELLEEREICGWATRLLKETHDRIARRVLPITERNMRPLLQQLTGGRYGDVRLTPEDTDGQSGEMDYRIRVWDPAAGRYVAKNIFSGGTRDQCSLALRLAFALATLPQELGVAPGFIFLDEPLSAFDSLRARALVELITTGTIARQFNQVILISHQHAFNREAFRYHVRMDAGQIVESDLPYSDDSLVEAVQLEPVSAVNK